MKQYASARSRLTVMLTAFLLLAGFASGAASAQVAPDTIPFEVASFSCDSDPGNVSPVANNIPDYCTPDTGASVTVATDDGTVSASCTTVNGFCIVEMPNEAFVTATEDAAPAGTAPRENPISTQAVTEFAGVLFINLPIAAPTEEPPETITFRITKYTCDLDPGNVSPVANNIPDYCTPTGGVMFEVTATDGTVLGSCTTDATGLCALELPNEATVVVTEDTMTSPAGTAPRENPVTTQVVTEFAGAFFVNLPVSVEPQPTTAPQEPQPTTVPGETMETPAPPVKLPSTGSGHTSTISNTELLAVVAGATLLSGLAALSLRRRVA